MEDLKIVVNGVEFHEINRQEFIVYGEEDRIPFMDSFKATRPPLSSVQGWFPYRIYKALVINNRFFAPKID